MPTEAPAVTVIDVVVPATPAVIEVVVPAAVQIVDVVELGPQGPAVDGAVTGDGITAIVKLTQAAYDALTPDEATLYVIVG